LAASGRFFRRSCRGPTRSSSSGPTLPTARQLALGDGRPRCLSAFLQEHERSATSMPPSKAIASGRLWRGDQPSGRRRLTRLRVRGACWCASRRSARLPPTILHRGRMRLIGLAVGVSLGLALTSLAGEAQPAEKVARVGILGIGPVPSPHDTLACSSLSPCSPPPRRPTPSARGCCGCR
jgi:hypothetical protein